MCGRMAAKPRDDDRQERGVTFQEFLDEPSILRDVYDQSTSARED